MEISVVIPVYNSAATLRSLMERLTGSLNRLGRRYEIIFIDDGSADASWDVLQELEHSHPGQVVAVQLMRNYGRHNALMCGFRRSRGRYVVTMDDDLQNPPEEIGKLVAERAKAKNITQVVFDRGGFTYHGKVKALADAARQTGLKF